MKKIITLASALTMGLTAFADGFNLYYDKADNSSQNNKIEAVTNIRKITFEQGNVVVTFNNGATTSIPSSTVSRLFFSSDNTVSITNVQDESDDKQPVEIHDLTGRRLDVNLSDLPKGIYIVDGKKVMVP